MFNLDNIIRTNIKSLKPYSSAREEFDGEANIFLDANENSLGTPVSGMFNGGMGGDYHRYPDPLQKKLKQEIGKLKGINPENIFLGNGSDECIDLLYRCFCEPGTDNAIICPPTYGMYEVSANINNVPVISVPLIENYQLDTDAILEVVDDNTKLIWICSPNNPTGNKMDRDKIKLLLNSFKALVIVDEAYIEFSSDPSFIASLSNYPNLVILQTFSKAMALAGLRLGMTFATKEIITVMNKVKPPYNINKATQGFAILALKNIDLTNASIAKLTRHRKELAATLETFPFVNKVYPSDANFLLVKVTKANELYSYLLQKGIVVRNRSNIILCEDCLRITIGGYHDNKALLTSLKEFETTYAEAINN